jgi:hypothetical protein
MRRRAISSTVTLALALVLVLASGCGAATGLVDAGADAADATSVDAMADVTMDASAAGGDADAGADATLDATLDARTDVAPDASVDASPVLVCGLPCTPKTCANFPDPGCAPARHNDGCGGQFRCDATGVCGGATSCCSPVGGACYAPVRESGPEPCGTFCMPKGCADLGPDTCGLMSDGCGGLLDCGACAGGRACVLGQCGPCPGDAGT